MTPLVVSATGPTVNAMRLQTFAAFELGADLVELRLDLLCDADDDADLDAMLADPTGPRIVTCRPIREGGQFDGPEADRLRRLLYAARRSGAMVDIELAAWHASESTRKAVAALPRPPAGGPGGLPWLILSHHDFRGRPDDLDGICKSADVVDAPHVLKIAWRAADAADSIVALSAMRERSSPTAFMCMGEGGLLSRVLAAKAGAALVYCSLEAHREAAHGQVPVMQMLDRYRFRSIDAATRVYGVVGCPVTHSLSPVVHNAAFAACALNAVYLPLYVNRDAASFNTFIEALRRAAWLNAGGLSVTIPHKIHAFDFVGDRAGPHARRIGAANTLVIEADGVSGYNTDYSAAVDTLSDVLGGEDMEGMRVLVLGAGGMARAVVYGLTEAGAELIISNRSPSPALHLAEEFRCGSITWDRRTYVHPDVIVNCTSVGMAPAVDQSPYPAAALHADMVVMDSVYTPVETRLIRDAMQAGATTATGDALFLRQAARQFHRFTGEVAPLETMHRALRVALGLDMER